MPDRGAVGARDKDRGAAGVREQARGAAAAEATNPAPVQLVTVSARNVDTKSRTWPASVVLTNPVPSAGQR
jgi:hypothetical protein